jgi:hypothetical protein
VIVVRVAASQIGAAGSRQPAAHFALRIKSETYGQKKRGAL